MWNTKKIDAHEQRKLGGVKTRMACADYNPMQSIPQNAMTEMCCKNLSGSCLVCPTNKQKIQELRTSLFDQLKVEDIIDCIDIKKKINNHWFY